MSPVDKGRFCGSCQKNIIDLSGYNDEELIKAIMSRKTVCGRFHPSQLDREIVMAPETVSHRNWMFKKAAAAILLLQALSMHTKAQSKKPATEFSEKTDSSRSSGTDHKSKHQRSKHTNIDSALVTAGQGTTGIFSTTSTMPASLAGMDELERKMTELRRNGPWQKFMSHFYRNQ